MNNGNPNECYADEATQKLTDILGGMVRLLFLKQKMHPQKMKVVFLDMYL